MSDNQNNSEKPQPSGQQSTPQQRSITDSLEKKPLNDGGSQEVKKQQQ